MEINEWKEAEMLTAADVASILNVPVSRGYTIIRAMNNELKSKGKLILRGRINRTYFEQKVLP